MSRFNSDHPTPYELRDLQPGGRLCDLPAHPAWRAIAAALLIGAFLSVLAFIVTPAARAVVEAATAHPAACATLTASDCAARMAEGF